jgi:UDP-N-acetylglucosamine--N-acetylmuramyl-(pentapeptide) pyrophosphoryl-undecaprenol N-acetylglucosamine transferase
MTLSSTRILLAAGGTAGHIYPAVALSREFAKRGVSSALVGATGGMEERLATEEKLEFFGVRAGKITRLGQGIPDPRGPLRAIGGLFDAAGVVRKYKPKLVVGFGGFASFPGVAGAFFTNTPLAMHEANAYPGLVTRLFASRAKVIALADEATNQHLKGVKTALVGMPVREEKLERGAARAQLGLEPDKFTLLVMGGSQGSVRLNALLPSLLERVLEGRNAQVIHQTGRGRLEEVQPKVAHLPWYHCVEYVDGVAAWSAADFAVTRAGMSTISDAAFHGVPLALVPLPTSAENHQVKNAEALQARGAGICVLEPDLERESQDISLGFAGTLTQGIISCFDMDRLTSWSAQTMKFSPAGAASRLADAVLGAL